jgi:DNA repair protein REV1
MSGFQAGSRRAYVKRKREKEVAQFGDTYKQFRLVCCDMSQPSSSPIIFATVVHITCATHAVLLFSESVPQIFQGLCIWVNGHTHPPAAKLRELVGQRGGRCRVVNGTDVTHIVASHLPSSKIQHYQSTRTAVKIVTPQWIVDSAKACRCLPVAQFAMRAISGGQRTLMNELTTRTPSSSSPVAAKRAKFSGHSTLTDPNFVDNYFKKSRLHYIGSWADLYEELLPELLALTPRFRSDDHHGPSSSVSAATAASRVVLHVDMDCFFASVAIRDDPSLRGEVCSDLCLTSIFHLASIFVCVFIIT